MLVPDPSDLTHLLVFKDAVDGSEEVVKEQGLGLQGFGTLELLAVGLDELEDFGRDGGVEEVGLVVVELGLGGGRATAEASGVVQALVF